MKAIPESKRQEIQRYLSHDLDTLYSTLDLIRSAKESMLYLPGNEVSRGIAKFKELVPLLRRKVCKEWDYCAKRHDPELQDTVSLVAVIADVIAALSLGFPPVLIATILLKKGLTSFCGCRRTEAGRNTEDFGQQEKPLDEGKARP